MTETAIRALIALLCVPLLAHAQAYKCKQPNGTMSFHERPCQAGEVAAPLALPRSTGELSVRPDESKDSKKASGRSRADLKQPGQATEQDAERRRADEEIRARNEQVLAYNKMQRCNHARQQLEVAKAQRPVFTRDNAGNRTYVEDKDRAGVIATAERRVGADCQ